jgi:hypothetical protein
LGHPSVLATKPLWREDAQNKVDEERDSSSTLGTAHYRSRGVITRKATVFRNTSKFLVIISFFATEFPIAPLLHPHTHSRLVKFFN